MEQQKLTTEEAKDFDSEVASERPVEISVVVPITERLDDLHELYVAYAKQLSAYGKSFEFIFVLDGPDGKILKVLNDLRAEHPNIRIVSLSRSFGESIALSVGFETAKAPVIVTLSSYFQVEPYETHQILNKLFEEDYDLVISWRYPRIDSLFNRMQSWVFHRLTQLLTGRKYHDMSCGLRAIKKRVVEEVHLYGDLHRFLPLLSYERGFKVVEVPVRQSQYDAKRRIYKPGIYLRRLLDILTLFFLFKFTKKPLRFFGLVGSGLLGIGAAITGYLGVYRLLGLGAIADRPILILGVLLIVLGVQLFSIGLLGEIIIFTHARKVKDYTIDRILN